MCVMHTAPHPTTQNGTTGKPADMAEIGLWEPFVVKVQTLKTAIEAACMILRIDDIVSGMSGGPGQG